MKFLEMFSGLRSGQLVADLDEALTELIEAVKDCEEKGTLTIKLEIKPAEKRGAAVVEVKDKVDLKAPRPWSGLSVRWVTPDNELTPRDPDQPELDLSKMN